MIPACSAALAVLDEDLGSSVALLYLGGLVYFALDFREGAKVSSEASIRLCILSTLVTSMLRPRVPCSSSICPDPLHSLFFRPDLESGFSVRNAPAHEGRMLLAVAALGGTQIALVDMVAASLLCGSRGEVMNISSVSACFLGLMHPSNGIGYAFTRPLRTSPGPRPPSPSSPSSSPAPWMCSFTTTACCTYGPAM
ncbi:hypothetical protein EXIGLDRAFT_21655 [Exidia glandulosa HHB12029]|uniref:Uncharacterized protein n=1 Tax=Exidia glandulosa HHB12029 TaxID=1314781 RepID=A0A165QZJ1_EXIGL|nr:hypothetical protein EXIGLDRAFT_21655 [Exidia glandulosa HHB12029]